MNQTQQRTKPMAINGEKDMPFFDLCTASMEWNETGTWRYLRPSYVERTPACQGSCPTSNDIEKWIRLFEKGKTAEAYDAATIENPFPGIMGRVCFHPCMDGCNRGEMGGSVNINMLERCMGDAMGEVLPPAKPFFPKTNKKVAVIGSGPAGLACAYHLARLGHEVSIFEKEKEAGGMLRYGIPSYRLPKHVLNCEIRRLMDMGIKFHLGTPVRDASKLQEIRQDYGVMFIATGAHRSKAMGVPDEKSEGVMSGLEMLWQVASGKKPFLGKAVLVVGGGNTAVDAARTARRMGCDVTILYRRSRAEMPASEKEIQDAEDEGVKIEILVAPKGIAMKNGRAAGLICQGMRLGEPDESGRRRPLPIEGSETTFDAGSILSAIGEDIDTCIIPSALHIERGSLATRSGGRTEWHNVFAGGDLIDAPRTVVDALSSGKKSAIAIDCMLRGDDFEKAFAAARIADTDYALMSRYIEYRGGKRMPSCTTSETERLDEVVKFDDLNIAYFTNSEPVKTPMIPPSERLGNNPFVEVKPLASDEDSKRELERCFHCGRCTECDNCYIYCPDVSIAKKDGGFEIDYYYCKGCGVCMTECPRQAMRMTEEPTEL